MSDYGQLNQRRVDVDRHEAEMIVQQMYGAILGMGRISSEVLQSNLPPQYRLVERHSRPTAEEETTMSKLPFPEDVFYAAEKAFYELRGWGEPTSNYISARRDDIEVICLAIMAERERCAALCELKANSHGWDYHMPSVGRELAFLIRKGA